jgi:hypothetical protein
MAIDRYSDFSLPFELGRQLDVRRSPIGNRDDLACFDCADRYRTPSSAVGWLTHLCLPVGPLGNWYPVFFTGVCHAPSEVRRDHFIGRRVLWGCGV